MGWRRRRNDDPDRLRPIYVARRASLPIRIGILAAVVVIGIIGTALSLVTAHSVREDMRSSTVIVQVPVESVTEGGSRSLIPDRITVKLADRYGDRRLRTFSVALATDYEIGQLVEIRYNPQSSRGRAFLVDEGELTPLEDAEGMAWAFATVATLIAVWMVVFMFLRRPKEVFPRDGGHLETQSGR